MSCMQLMHAMPSYVSTCDHNLKDKEKQITICLLYDREEDLREKYRYL